MAFKHHKSFFVQEEIEALQRAFDNACFALGLEHTNDRVPRERLGALIFEIAGTGIPGEAVLASLAVRRYRGAGVGHMFPGGHASAGTAAAASLRKMDVSTRSPRSDRSTH